jgi:cleavage and polyadenylation specificity factor subunit 1
MDGIISMEDEEGEEHSILNASFADPYLLVLLDNSTVKLYKASGSDEIEEMEASGLRSTQWLSASLFKSSTFSEIYAFLLTHEGGLHVSNLRTCCQADTKLNRSFPLPI